MKRIAIGVGENENIIQACHIFKEKHPDTDIKLIYSDNDLVNAVLDKNIDGVVRGSLPASNIMKELKERYPNLTRATYVNCNEFEFLFQRTKIYIKYEVVESRSGAQVIEIKMEAPTAGIWTFRIYGEIVLNGIFNIWLPVTEMIGNNTYFLRPDPYTTLTIPADTYIPLSVGAYNDESGGIFIESGRGNPTNMTIKPCLVAPGVNIYGTDINNTYTQRSGTSISAAITAGVMAQFMEWGILRGTSINMSTIDIKNYLIRGARRRPTITYPDREWGYGILDAYNSLDILRS